jgi:hypothetical protein
VSKEVAPQVSAQVVGLPALIALKLEADRPQDRADIDKLRKLHPGI